MQVAQEYASEYELEEDGTVCASGVPTPKNVQFQILQSHVDRSRDVELCLYRPKHEGAASDVNSVEVKVQDGRG